MSEYRSPYLVTRHEIYVSDDTFYPDLQKKVLFRASRMRPARRWGLLWGFAINAVLWGLFGCLIYWIGQLGFWDWIRGWFR